MRLIACCKVVHDEQDITTRPDRSLDMDNAGLKISLYDLNALEAATDIAKQQPDSQLIALSAGNKAMLENSKIRKDILSRGPDELAIVADDAFHLLYPTETAKILASAAQKIGFDLLLCGEGSGDLYAQQTGIQIGAQLNLPCINAVRKITVGEGKILVERELEDTVEELELSLPAVISVTSDINTPKLPSMKAILAANKKPVTQWDLSTLACELGAVTATRESACAPKQADRLRMIIEGDSDENIAAFAEHLRQAISQ